MVQPCDVVPYNMMAVRVVQKLVDKYICSINPYLKHFGNVFVGYVDFCLQMMLIEFPNWGYFVHDFRIGVKLLNLRNWIDLYTVYSSDDFNSYERFMTCFWQLIKRTCTVYIIRIIRSYLYFSYSLFILSLKIFL